MGEYDGLGFGTGWYLKVGLGAALLAVVVMPDSAFAQSAGATDPMTIEALTRSDRLGVEVVDDGDKVTLRSDGRPVHRTGSFPMMADTDNDGRPDNPNSIQRQSYRFTIPRHPELASRPTDLPMGPIGISVSGAVFFNPYTHTGGDAVRSEVFDGCKGHPDQRGAYHYHQFSDCVPATGAAADGHDSLFGWAFDGFGVYGLLSVGATAPADLDKCNGHSDAPRGYHYHATAKFPYLMGCYAGEVARLPRPGGPPGGGPGGGPGGPQDDFGGPGGPPPHPGGRPPPRRF